MMKRISLILLCLGLVFWACNDDDNPSTGGGSTIPQATVDPSDANAVTVEMGVSNPTWTAKTGTAPASNGTIGVTSFMDADTVPVTNGRTAAIDLNIAFGDTTDPSILFEVQNANAHYEVPVDPDGRYGMLRKGGVGESRFFDAKLIPKTGVDRQGNANNGYLFVFNIPSSVKSGKFLIRFAVKNGAGDISNYITVCIQIVQRGGNGVGTLTSKWWKSEKSVISFTFTNPITGRDTTIEEIEFFGMKDYDTGYYQFPCPGGGTGILEVIEWDQENQYLRFYSNGDATFEEEWEDRQLDWANSDCTNAVYIDDSGTDSDMAGWGYDPATKIMSITYDGYYDEFGNYISPYIQQVKVVSQSPNKIVISVIGFDDEFFEDATFEFHLIPK